ncbi:hypothetical protein GCM10010218_62340 [Streptomyces mashuensis]|uniref:Uncharacterized protein n=1 Tax=Streptomyces mashuensis TaxID=33904 RepID=A0A919B9S7_9ACTN|nr:hypothetical protein GCM10010218_62340 [Streptomyces mashuensis]
MYAAAISGTGGLPPLLKPETAAEFAQVHSHGINIVFGTPDAFALGFAATWLNYPFLSAGAFGHSGAAGSQAFADPASGLAFGYNRRRFAFPGGAAPETVPLARAVHACATRG